MSLLKNRIMIVVFLFCVSFSGASLAQEMIYKNQRGSIIKLVLHPEDGKTGTITGTFTTAVGCKTDVGVPLPMTGFFNGNAIAVSVNFPHCKQVLSMTGHLLEENNALNTLWMGTSQSLDPMKNDLAANTTGADYFKRESK